MIPFLFFDLKTIITRLIEIIVQPEIIESCKSARQLKESDLTDKTKPRLTKLIVVNRLKQSHGITSSQTKEFKKGTQLFVVMMLSKLFEKNPLGSAVLRCASVFDPLRMLVLPREKLHEKFKVLQSFIDLGVISPQNTFLAEDLLQNMLRNFKAFQLRQINLKISTSVLYKFLTIKNSHLS